jgi:flavin-dependent dehydrogenase
VKWHTDVQEAGSYDVVVCGGGPAGCAAALAAARRGASTLLLEGLGQLGGMGTSGLVSQWLGGRKNDGTRVFFRIREHGRPSRITARTERHCRLGDMTESMNEPERELPVPGQYDAVVCGGGPAGCTAAVAAARHGAKTE